MRDNNKDIFINNNPNNNYNTDNSVDDNNNKFWGGFFSFFEKIILLLLLSSPKGDVLYDILTQLACVGEVLLSFVYLSLSKYGVFD